MIPWEIAFVNIGYKNLIIIFLSPVIADFFINIQSQKAYYQCRAENYNRQLIFLNAQRAAADGRGYDRRKSRNRRYD